jgi:glutaredoxin-related protein
MYILFGHNNCAWCSVAKNELDKRNLPHRFENIYEDSTEFLQYFPFAKAVPQVVLLTPNDGDHEYMIIGGYPELMKHLN